MLKISLRLALAFSLIPGAAFAAPAGPSEAPVARISYADLNLARPEGQSVLEGRVRRAAETLCVDNRVTDLVRRSIARACYKSAMASARPQLDQAFAAAASGRRFAAAERLILLSSRR